MRLLLTGASGYLGRHLAPQATKHFELWSVCYAHPENLTAGQPVVLDLKDKTATRRALAEIQPEIIVHAAGSNRDDQNLAAIVPAAGTLAGYAQQAGAWLIHFSTDLVFDGERAPYGDEARPEPISPYGSRKAEAETLVQALNPAALIVRPSLIYGFDPIDAQTSWLVQGMQRGETVRLFTDEFRCPVWVNDLSLAMLELAALPAAARPSGPLNLGGPQPLSRWEFGMKLLDALGLQAGPNVIRSTVAESGLVRARNLTMLSKRAARLLKTGRRTVDEVVSLRRQGRAGPQAAEGSRPQ